MGDESGNSEPINATTLPLWLFPQTGRQVGAGHCRFGQPRAAQRNPLAGAAGITLSATIYFRSVQRHAIQWARRPDYRRAAHRSAFPSLHPMTC
jgi:hypothetical protein